MIMYSYENFLVVLLTVVLFVMLNKVVLTFVSVEGFLKCNPHLVSSSNIRKLVKHLLWSYSKAKLVPRTVRV